MAQAHTGLRFCGCPINRASALSMRKDPHALKRILDGPDAQFLLVSSKKVMISHAPAAQLAWHRLDEVLKIEPSAAELSVYLGPMHLEQDRVREVFVTPLISSTSRQPDAAWAGGRELAASNASDSDVSIAGLALGMIAWHETALYDGRTGLLTKPVEGGMKRQVKEGNGKLYPRTDPVAIGMIVSPDRSKCLLVRSRTYPAGMYTCISGFVEQCETVEEAFVREALEEAGVKLTDVGLVTSQPWPIGRAGSCELMVACHATATSSEIRVNHDEIEDARWFSKDEVRQMLSRSTSDSPYSSKDGGLFVPPPLALAHHLVTSFVASESAHAEAAHSSTNMKHVGMAAAVGIAAGFALALLPNSLTRSLHSSRM